MLSHGSRSRYIDPGRPPAADGGLRSQYPDLVLAVGSRSTAGSCSRLACALLQGARACGVNCSPLPLLSFLDCLVRSSSPGRSSQDVLSILGGQKVFLRRCGLESRPVVPKHARSRLVAHTWMSVVLTPMSVKVKSASKIRRDPARRRPAPTPERATA